MTNQRPTTKKFAKFGLLLLLACAATLIVLRTREPRYHGRRLTSWLQQYTDLSQSETNRWTEARDAIRAIGAKRSLPILLKLITARDGAFRKWAMELSDKFNLRFLHWHDETESHISGLAGFEVLGSNAAPALGTLTKLLNDKNNAFMAARCLEHIGKPAEAALCQCLTNQDWRVRSLSVSALAEVTDDVETYISRAKSCLKDTNSSVRVAAVEGIGAQVNAPDLVVPILNETLNSTDDMVAETSAEAIWEFGTNGAPAFSSLTNLIASGRPQPTRVALQALAAVAPTQAVPILSNFVVNGDNSLTGTALKSLKSIAPELSVQMTRAEMCSPEPRRRMVAISVATIFDVNTPGIAEALKSATHDEDPKVARQANRIIREMLQAQKGKTHGMVFLPDDPEYHGKRLGEWLQMRQNYSRTLSTNAVEALRSMGTNAIPALLRRLEYKDPVFGQPDWDVGMEGVTGLITLGESARPALPRLSHLMDADTRDLALQAMLAALGTGTDAIPCLIKGMTNQFPDVRNQAAGFLTGDWSSKYPAARKQAVPYLENLLNDPDQDVRTSAANALKQLDPQAAAQAGIK